MRRRPSFDLQTLLDIGDDGTPSQVLKEARRVISSNPPIAHVAGLVDKILDKWGMGRSSVGTPALDESDFTEFGKVAGYSKIVVAPKTERIRANHRITYELAFDGSSSNPAIKGTFEFYNHDIDRPFMIGDEYRNTLNLEVLASPAYNLTVSQAESVGAGSARGTHIKITMG